MGLLLTLSDHLNHSGDSLEHLQQRRRGHRTRTMGEQTLCAGVRAFVSDDISRLCALQYFNALMGCQLLGIKVVPLPLDPQNGFLPSLEVADKLINSKTKAILLM
jgi:acyl-CoA synthetase (AMP-forming)/AMP-acid ligase II